LRRVLDKALAHVPEARYRTAAELADDLDAYLGGRPTRLDTSRVLRAALWCKRNPQLSLTAAAALVLAMITLVTTVAVIELRARARDLRDDVSHAEAGKRDVETRAASRRAELVAAEAELAAKTASLAQVRHELADEQAAYHAIIAARERALQSADAATRALADQLAASRSDRAAADFGRSLYEGYWRSARDEADRAAKDRDQAQRDRDQFARERDATRAERDRLQADLDRARADLARLQIAAAESSARIIALEHELAGSRITDAGTRD
jgi:serine/threonine-protein kinase